MWKKKAIQTNITIIMENKMIDIHSHILPTVDDGSRNKEESIEILKFIFNRIYRHNINPSLHKR